MHSTQGGQGGMISHGAVLLAVCEGGTDAVGRAAGGGSQCGEYGLSSNMMALIVSDCGQSFVFTGRPRAARPASAACSLMHSTITGRPVQGRSARHVVAK